MGHFNNVLGANSPIFNDVVGGYHLHFNYVLGGKFTQLLVLGGTAKVFLNRGVSLLSGIAHFDVASSDMD